MPEPEKSLGQKILSFFVKDESAPRTDVSGTDVPGTTGAGVPLPGTQPPASQTAPSTARPVANGAPGEIDAKFADHFTEVLSKANVPGPDYFEFRETLRNLADLGLPEDKRYQAAWASFKAIAGNVDVAMLTSTANGYLTALNADRELFLKSVETALNERVGGLQNEQKALLADNEAIAKQIAELQKRQQANNDRLSNIGGEIAEQSTKLTQNRNNFEVTYASFTEQIKHDVSKIQTYLTQ
ncbi:hypothetical protein [Rudanella paleaurantiibacter]|nr:hypothetical protein [Rudanella paleaurantiibacter]